MKKNIALILFLYFLYPYTIVTQNVHSIIELAPAHRTYYDIQSNGSSHLVQVDSNTMNNIHAVFQCSPLSDSLNSSRRVIYCYSNNNGTSWDDYGPMTSQYQSGFPVIRILSDGCALIGLNANMGTGIERAQWFADVAPGAGTFTWLDPGVSGTGPLLPNGIETSSIINQTKFVFVAGTLWNRGLNITTPSFSGYTNEPAISNSFLCAFARSNNNKIGMAYILHSGVIPGRVLFRESTDNGVFWSEPVLIWDPAINNGYGAYNGIDMAYTGNSPNIVFETVKYISNQPDIHSTAFIQFWSPDVNSGNPLKLDSSNNMTGANPQADGYAPVCRPVIGKAGIYSTLVAYCKARTDVLDSNNYFDVYYRLSSDYGNNWSSPARITNTSGSLKDNRYVSISSINSVTPSPNFHLVYQQDSVPGSFVNGAGRSLAKIMYCKIVLLPPPYGIQNIGTQLPAFFMLKQNYPNPFNPKTNIEFDIPKESDVRITIYNLSGEICAIPVDQPLNAGSYKVDWDAGEFASGVYFYSISAGDFYETKRMILLK